MSHFAELERRLTCTGGSKEACTSINHDLAISSADCICGDTCNTTSPSDITSDITSSSQASTPTPTAIKTPTPSHPSIQLGSTPQESSFTHCLIPSPSAFTIGGSTTVGYQPGSCGNLLSPYIRHHLPTLSPPASPFTPLTPGPHSKPSHRQAIDFKKPPSLKLTSSRQRRPPSLRLAQTDSYSESLIEEQLESLSLSRNVRFADGSPMKASTWHLTQYPSRLASPPISAANLSLADLIELESIKQSLGTWCGEIMGSPMRSSFSQSSIASSISEITGGSDDDYDGVKDDYDYDFIKGKLKEEDDSHGKNLDSIKSSAFKHKSMKGFGNLIIAGANQRQILGLDSSNDSKSGDMNSLNGSRKTSGELYSSPSSYAENKSLYNVDYDSWLESSDSESDCDSEIFEGVH
ncbi:hypothetical protein BY996DRAFT_6408643 [Phakopsora pachyrhizi]|nr:hypothetical protein BY996DRAFT_6408643 [Phakopsora pachyrhizi]